MLKLWFRSKFVGPYPSYHIHTAIVQPCLLLFKHALASGVPLLPIFFQIETGFYQGEHWKTQIARCLSPAWFSYFVWPLQYLFTLWRHIKIVDISQRLSSQPLPLPISQSMTSIRCSPGVKKISLTMCSNVKLENVPSWGTHCSLRVHRPKSPPWLV